MSVHPARKEVKRAPTEQRNAAEANEASSYRQEKSKLVERSMCVFQGVTIANLTDTFIISTT